MDVRAPVCDRAAVGKMERLWVRQSAQVRDRAAVSAIVAMCDRMAVCAIERPSMR